MACYHPLTAYRRAGGYNPKTGKTGLTFNASNACQDEEALQIPCGQCIGCRLERSRQWAIRCLHEASLYRDNCFVTLTYRDENLPRGINTETGEIGDGLPSLNKRDMVLFLKKLRKRFGAGIRFFQCGEYGELHGRPHHHIIIFNFDFPDRKYAGMSHGIPLYTSQILSVGDDDHEPLWPHGIAKIGNVTFESAAYVARYITKKITGKKASSHYGGILSEYNTMSRRPGIAREWFEKNSADIYPNDRCIVRADLIARPPRYYDKIYDLTNPVNLAKIKQKRVELAKASPDNTRERLSVRETIQKWKANKLKRLFEKGEC